jgi:hypothetical protein
MKKPFVFVRRDYFSEEPFLRKMLEVSAPLSAVGGYPPPAGHAHRHVRAGGPYQCLIPFPAAGVISHVKKRGFDVQIHRCAVEMKRQDFFEGRWQPYLDRAAVIQPNYSGRLDGGKVGPDDRVLHLPLLLCLLLMSFEQFLSVPSTSSFCCSVSQVGSHLHAHSFCKRESVGTKSYHPYNFGRRNMESHQAALSEVAACGRWVVQNVSPRVSVFL